MPRMKSCVWLLRWSHTWGSTNGSVCALCPAGTLPVSKCRVITGLARKSHLDQSCGRSCGLLALFNEGMGHTRDNFNRMLATAVRLAGGDQNQASGFERQVLHVPSTRDQHLPEVGLQLRTAAAVQWVHGAMSLEQACFCSKECFFGPIHLHHGPRLCKSRRRQRGRTGNKLSLHPARGI